MLLEKSILHSQKVEYLYSKLHKVHLLLFYHQEVEDFQIEKLSSINILINGNRTCYELPNYLKRQFSWYKTKYKNTLWRVIYKNIVYYREEKNNTYYWTIENRGQTRELYDIQNELELEFMKTIRKNKLLKIRKNKLLNLKK